MTTTATESRELSREIIQATYEAEAAIQAYRTTALYVASTGLPVNEAIVTALTYESAASMDRRLYALITKRPRAIEARYDQLAGLRNLRNVAKVREDALCVVVAMAKEVK